MMLSCRRACALVSLLLAGCTGSADSLTIQTVSEYGGTAIAGVKVQVGDQPWTTTDASGKARFAAAVSPYTVRIHQAMIFTDLHGAAHQNDKVWQLVGQDKNPLIVQVDGSLAQIYKATLSGTVTGRSASSGSDVLVAAGVDGIGWFVSPAGTFDGPAAVWWEGATARDIDVRAFELAAGQAGQLPAHYTAYGSTRIHAVDDSGFLGGGGAVRGIAIPLHSIPEAHVSGQILRPDALAQGIVQSSIFLRFGEYDSVAIGFGAPPQSSPFDYTLPAIEGAAPWIAVTALPALGSSAYGLHARRVSLPSTGVVFSVPAPATLAEPADSAAIGASTVFRWSAVAPGGTYALDLDCDEWTVGAVRRTLYYRGVETAATEVSLPAIPDVSVSSGTACRGRWVGRRRRIRR
jgi:hypothetical protein